MFTVFVYADVVDTTNGSLHKATCIQQFKALGTKLVDVIAEGEEHAYSLSDLYNNVEFAVWNERARCVDFRGRPSRILYETRSVERS